MWGFFGLYSPGKKKKSMQICSVWLIGNSCKATGITVSLGIFFFPLPCTCRVDLNRVISSGVGFSKVNLTNSVVREFSQFVPVITLVRATTGLQSAGPGVEFRWNPRCSLTSEIPQGTQRDHQLLCKTCLLEVMSSTCHPLRDVLTSLVAPSTGYLCLGTSLPPSLQSGQERLSNLSWLEDALRSVETPSSWPPSLWGGWDVGASRLPKAPAPRCQWA